MVEAGAHPTRPASTPRPATADDSRTEMVLLETHHDLAEAAFQTLTAFPDAEVSLPCDPCAAAAMWTARLWGDRGGWACVYLGHGGHYPEGSSAYTFTRFEERWFRWPDDRGRLLQLALTAGSEADVYAGCLLRTTRSRKAGNALPGLVAWADVDGPWTPQRQAALDRLDGLPVWQVASGDQGRHVYVRLGVEAEAPERIEAWNRRIGALLEADAGWSETKILRLPGTFNHKPQRGRPLPVPVRGLP
jgi:hypothetical protein